MTEPTTLRCVACTECASGHPAPFSAWACGLPLVRAAEGPCETCGWVDKVEEDGLSHEAWHGHAYLGPWKHDDDGWQVLTGHTPVPESEPVAEETQ